MISAPLWVKGRIWPREVLITATSHWSRDSISDLAREKASVHDGIAPYRPFDVCARWFALPHLPLK
jgi:hypothetical protein